MPNPIPELAERAEVVTICGSSKFKTEILAEVARLTIEGKLVVSLGVFGHHDMPDFDWSTDTTGLKTMLDALHRQKIDIADSVHVVNPGGYHGESTEREIMYARSIGKPVTFMVSCVHCGVGLMSAEGHSTHLGRCQSKEVPYGHLAHAPGTSCRVEGPNPCLGAHEEGGCSHLAEAGATS